jgi:hypothetical protein
MTGLRPLTTERNTCKLKFKSNRRVKELLPTFVSNFSLSIFLPAMILSVGKRSAANLHIGPTPKKSSWSFDGNGC